MAMNDAAERSGPHVGMIMGSMSDWKTMGRVADTLNALGIRNSPRVISAHRSPDTMFKYAAAAEDEGFSLIIAGAGGAAHLPGMTAAKAIVPVIGVPVVTTPLKGLDALLSIMQMPAEVGVATVAVGERGAVHAGLFAATVLALHDPRLYPALRSKRTDLVDGVEVPKGSLAQTAQPRVLILAGREADREFMHYSEEFLEKLGYSYQTRVVERDATAEQLLQLTREAERDRTSVFIAGSEEGASLAANVARTTLLPVLAVPTTHAPVESLDSFLQPLLDLPAGVAAFAVNRPGAINAALFAANILGGPGSETRRRLKQMQEEHLERVQAMNAELQALLTR